MSYTTLYGIRHDGSLDGSRQFRNSYGSAYYVWDALGQRHLGRFSMSEADRVWKLFRDESLPEHTRAVLGATFDHVVVKAEDFGRLADAMDLFVAESPPETGTACSIPDQAALLREMASSGEYRGACWQQMSVACDLWWVRIEEPEGGWPEDYEGDYSRPYDFDVDTDHWDLYEALRPETVLP